MRDFENKSILITGVGREGQLGEAVAAAFAARGARIIALDRTLANVEQRAEALRATGADAHAFAADLTDASQIAAAAHDIAAVTGSRLDALVTLAGGFAASGPVRDSDPEIWNQQWQRNAVTAYLTTRAFLPMLRAAKGSIVFVASAAVLPGASVANVSGYAAAKGAVVTLMRAVAVEERGTVRANAVAPISIKTAANLSTMGAEARYVTREAVADAIVFLSSDDARGVTGSLLALE